MKNEQTLAHFCSVQRQEFKTPSRDYQKSKALNTIKSDLIPLRMLYQSIKESNEIENIPYDDIDLLLFSFSVIAVHKQNFSDNGKPKRIFNLKTLSNKDEWKILKECGHFNLIHLIRAIANCWRVVHFVSFSYLDNSSYVLSDYTGT